MNRILIFICILFFSFSAHAQHTLMPVPSNIEWTNGKFILGKHFYIVLNDTSGSRAGKAVLRFLRRLDNKTTLLLAKEYSRRVISNEVPLLTIAYKRTGKLVPGEDESYELKISENHASLYAETDFGILHGLETFLQLIESNEQGFYLPTCNILDKPRFVWRGLLIDVARHFFPVDVIKRNLDGMAMVKMNVLHLHLTEDQGFRIESKKFPKLHQLGSNGFYYTQEQVKEIIDYAADRGIRVIPEFDMPGHTGSWFVGYPELASGKGPYSIEKKFGVFDPTLDPTKESTYKFLDKFISEMCLLFPDEYFHIGGDENNGKQWDANKDIQEWMQKKGIKNNHELQNYFNSRLMKILKKNKKKMIGWDEILQPGLSTDAVIQSWRGKDGLKDAASKGYKVILSNGYYIDLAHPAWKHYENDPSIENEELQKYVLGGEATMWSENVTVETVDSRIWPRTAAIAERLWSDREVSNRDDMYRRLDKMEIRLEEAGLLHIKNREMMLRRLTGSENTSALLIVAQVMEPLKDYQRGGQKVPYSTDLPFSRLPDIATPDSRKAKEFKRLCELYIMRRDTNALKEIKIQLLEWRNNHTEVLKLSGMNPALKGFEMASLKLSGLAETGLEILEVSLNKNNVSTEWVKQVSAKIAEARLPVDESELMIVDSINMLFQNALPK